jgi:hypothetical protein
MNPKFSLLILLSLTLAAEVQARPRGEMIFSQESFISPDFAQTDQTNYQYIGTRLTTDQLGQQGVEGLQGEVKGMFSPGAPVLSYLNISQLYWQDQELRVGRKKEKWSDIDTRWNLGLYQPLFKWNPLLPEEQGLTGIFISIGRSDLAIPWGMTLMGSPLFIPDQGAGFEIQNGRFVKNNPFFQTPPSQVQVQNQVDAIEYTIERPDTNDIIMNRSFAARAFVGDELDGFYAQLASAYKPMNQLALGFEGFLGTNSSLEITVLPSVTYHSLISGDLHFARKGFLVGVSYLSESPESPEYDSRWTYARYGKSQMISPFIGFKNREMGIALSYISISGGETTATGPRAANAKDVIPQRFPFKAAYRLSAQAELIRIKKKSVFGDASYMQNPGADWSLLQTDIHVQFHRFWTAFGGVQLAKAQDSQAGKQSYLNPFQNNDSVNLGVSYVF